MKYLLAGSLLATTAVALGTTVQVTQDMATVEATITSCKDNACAQSTTPAPVTTTTPPPQLDAQAVTPQTSTDLTTEQSTTLVTITSCKDNACASSVTTAAITVVTQTVNDVETVYTTYCPLTTETPGTQKLAAAAVTPSPSSSDSDVYVDVDVTVNVSEDATVYQDVTAYVSGDEVTYVDVTVTPTDTISTGVEATKYVGGSTLTSVYQSKPSIEAYKGSSTSSASSNATIIPQQFEGVADRVQGTYAAGLAVVALGALLGLL